MQLMDKLSNEKDTSIVKNKDWNERTAPGIWGIVKLVIDDAVTNRRLVDSSASSANGPIINFLKKVCQEPFVEFYGDTYGDMYHFVVRKPPYDRKSIYSLLGYGEVTNNETGEKYKPTVIEIETESVIQESINYNGRDAYSWYHFSPQADLFGSSGVYSLAHLPGLYFEEYAEIWGSKPMQVVHNYVNNLPMESKDDNVLSVTERQSFEDMKYLVESSAYLPFTKEGTILLTGDRRIKIGNIIRYKGWIYFVDAVRQSYANRERQTLVQVSRGMDENFIKPQEIDGVKISYFDIINTDLVFEKKKMITKVTKTRKIGERQVDRSIFNPQSGSSYTPTTTDLNNFQQVGDLYNAAKSMLGMKYGFGSTGSGSKIDCSGFIRQTLTRAGISHRGGVSEDLVVNANNFREVSNVDPGSLREGDVIGFDHGPKYSKDGTQWDGGRTYGMDHIGIVVYNYNTGQLEFAESVSGTGVKFTPIIKAMERYNKRAKRKFIGDYRGGVKSVKYKNPSGSVQSTSSDSYTEPIYETYEEEVESYQYDRSLIFSNFRVNKKVFNFFLRRQNV